MVRLERRRGKAEMEKIKERREAEKGVKGNGKIEKREKRGNREKMGSEGFAIRGSQT